MTKSKEFKTKISHANHRFSLIQSLTHSVFNHKRVHSFRGGTTRPGADNHTLFYSHAVIHFVCNLKGNAARTALLRRLNTSWYGGWVTMLYDCSIQVDICGWAGLNIRFSWEIVSWVMNWFPLGNQHIFYRCNRGFEAWKCDCNDKILFFQTCSLQNLESLTRAIKCLKVTIQSPEADWDVPWHVRDKMQPLTQIWPEHN